MTCRRLGLLALLVVGLAAASCGGDDEDTAAPATTQETSATGEGGGTTLNGSVGPGFEISLDGTDGLTAGDHTLVVDDKATIHNFHLTGPGVDVATDVGGEGQETFQIRLEPGEYRFVCDPHASSMNGSFTVG
jgi:plastocyanin